MSDALLQPQPPPARFADMAVSAFLAARAEEAGIEGLITEIEGWKEGLVTLALPPEVIGEVIANARIQAGHLREIARMLRLLGPVERLIRHMVENAASSSDQRVATLVMPEETAP